MKYTGPNGETLKSNSPSGDSFILAYAKLCQKHKERENEWIKSLRSKGVKAAHPDDGWVKDNNVQFRYPQFCDDVSVGCKIALGNANNWRIVRITGMEIVAGVFERYMFEPA